MQDVVLMGVLDGPRERRNIPRRHLAPHRPLSETLRQAGALDVLHAEVRTAIDLTHFIDVNDIRMVEAGRGLSLRAEAAQVLWSGYRCTENHLDGYHPVKVRLIGFEDDPHAPPAEFGNEFVLAESTPDAI